MILALNKNNMTDSLINISIHSYFATGVEIKKTIESISKHVPFLLKIYLERNKLTHKTTDLQAFHTSLCT